jgi:hypothetical protein
MTKPLLLIIAVAMLTFSTVPALAEDVPEVNLAKGLLLYESFQHWINVTYDFRDSKSGQNSNSSNDFRESYNASLQIALIDPRILDVNLQGSFVLDQSKNSTESSWKSNFSSWQPLKKPIPPVDMFQYNFGGSGLSRSRIPFSLLSFRTINKVQNTYTAPTSTDNVGNGFNITFLNEKLKSSFFFNRSNTDTTTDNISSNSLSNTYSYNAEHHFGSFSTTSFSVAFTDQNGSTSSGDTLSSSANSLQLHNSLLLGSRRNYTLTSSLQLTNSMTDKLPTRSLSVSEALGAALGQALFLTTTYALTNNRNSLPDGTTQENTQNQGDINVTHKLFESLHTTLQGTVAFNKENEGTDNKYSVRGTITYNKKLAEGNLLSLGVSKGYDLADRQLGSNTSTVRDELHAGMRQGDVIKLALSDGTLRNVISIKSRDPIFTYVEGVDYTVNYTLGRITILSGGGVRIDMNGAGTDLYISYTIFKDPSLKYSTDTLSLNSSLTLFDSLLTLGASWSEAKHTLISGPASNSLQDSNSLMLSAESNYDTFTARISYAKEASGTLGSQIFEGSVAKVLQTSNAIVALTTRDSYSLFDATLTSASYWSNSADMSLSYRRDILANTTLTLQSNINDSRSDQQSARDSLSFKASCQSTMNLVTISLSGQTSWLLDTHGTSRNDSVQIDLTRRF